MSDLRKSSRPVICRPQSRSPLLNSADGCATCPATKKWWPPAVAPAARLPIKPFVFSNRPGFMPDGSRTDCRSGKPQVFPWSPWGKGGLELATTLTRKKIDVQSMDPYAFMAVLGKRVIHPGGRRSTEELFDLARLQDGQKALDGGCGGGPGASQMARRFGAAGTPIGIPPVLPERARRNVQPAGPGREVEGEP